MSSNSCRPTYTFPVAPVCPLRASNRAPSTNSTAWGPVNLKRAVNHEAHEDHEEAHEERQTLEDKARRDLAHLAVEGASLRILLNPFVFFVLFVVQIPNLG